MIENYGDLGLRLYTLGTMLKVLMLGVGYHVSCVPSPGVCLFRLLSDLLIVLVHYVCVLWLLSDLLMFLIEKIADICLVFWDIGLRTPFPFPYNGILSSYLVFLLH